MKNSIITLALLLASSTAYAKPTLVELGKQEAQLQQQYTVLKATSNNIKKLEAHVNKAMRSGWKPHAGLECDDSICYREMIKPTN